MRKNSEEWKKRGHEQAEYIDSRLDVFRSQLNGFFEILDELNFKTVLEVGCSNGWILEFIRNRYDVDRLVGLDINEKAIATMKERNPDMEAYAQDAIDGLPFKDNEFDLVYTSEFMCHVYGDDVDDLRKDLYRVAKNSLVLHENFRKYHGDKQLTSRKRSSWYGTINHNHTKYFTIKKMLEQPGLRDYLIEKK